MPADLCVLAFDGAHLASIGIFLDAFDLVRARVAKLFGQRDLIEMETQTRLVGPAGLPFHIAGKTLFRLDGGLPSAPSRLVHIPDFTSAMNDQESTSRGADEVVRWIAAQHSAGAIISATGRAIFLVAQAGIIDRCTVPLSGSTATAFRARYPHIRVDRHLPLIDHGSIVLSRGMAHEQRLMVHLVTRLMSPTMAGALAQQWGLESEGEEGLSDDPLIAAAQVWIGERYTGTPRITELAHFLAVSQQTLTRRFKAQLDLTPRDYIQLLRVRAAQSQLRQTDRSVAQIAMLVGYDDQRSFREAFRARTGMSASHYRRRTRRAGE